MARTRPFNDLTTGQPASGIQRLYYAMPLDDRIVMRDDDLLATDYGTDAGRTDFGQFLDAATDNL